MNSQLRTPTAVKSLDGRGGLFSARMRQPSAPRRDKQHAGPIWISGALPRWAIYWIRRLIKGISTGWDLSLILFGKTARLWCRFWTAR